MARLACPVGYIIDLSRSYVHARSSGYIDHVVSMRDHVPATPEDYWYHHDDLFSPMVVTDDAGAVYERYEYDDYGVPVILAPGNDYVNDARGSSSNDNRVLFTGRYYDTETGLYYYRTRYLDGKLGRFTTRDTIGVWGDPANLGNGLTYVGSAPLDYVDPLGEFLFTPFWDPNVWPDPPGRNPDGTPNRRPPVPERDRWHSPDDPWGLRPGGARPFLSPGDLERQLRGRFNERGRPGRYGALSMHGDKDGPYFVDVRGNKWYIKDAGNMQGMDPDGRLRDALRDNYPSGLWIHACGDQDDPKTRKSWQRIADWLNLPIFKERPPGSYYQFRPTGGPGEWFLPEGFFENPLGPEGPPGMLPGPDGFWEPLMGIA